jgi:hypothetical protein
VTVGGLAVDPMEHFSAKDVEALSEDTAYESGATETTASVPEAVTKPDGK